MNYYEYVLYVFHKTTTFLVLKCIPIDTMGSLGRHNMLGTMTYPVRRLAKASKRLGKYEGLHLSEGLEKLELLAQSSMDSMPCLFLKSFPMLEQ